MLHSSLEILERATLIPNPWLISRGLVLRMLIVVGLSQLTVSSENPIGQVAGNRGRPGDGWQVGVEYLGNR